MTDEQREHLEGIQRVLKGRGCFWTIEEIQERAVNVYEAVLIALLHNQSITFTGPIERPTAKTVSSSERLETMKLYLKARQ